MNNVSQLFDISPQVEELINYAQYGVTIEVPTQSGSTLVSLTLLWESEMLDISKRSAVVCNVYDEMSRAEFMKIETLVLAINKIGEQVFQDEEDEVNKSLKNNLRMILGKSSPITVDFLYEMYDTLSKQRNLDMNEKVNEIKKKNLKTILKVTPL